MGGMKTTAGLSAAAGLLPNSGFKPGLTHLIQSSGEFCGSGPSELLLKYTQALKISVCSEAAGLRGRRSAQQLKA